MDNSSVELLAELTHEQDGWPFTVRTFRTSEAHTVQSFLRNMPVSHVYVVDAGALETQASQGVDAVAKLVELAVKDLDQGEYRKWIIHWASQ